MDNTEILEQLIEEDFGLEAKDGSRWGKSSLHNSLVLDRERGIFFWNSQNIVGDPTIYLTKVRKMSFKDARDYLQKFKNFTSTLVYTINTDTEDVVVYPKLVEVFNELGRQPERRDYWYRRGIGDTTIDRFQLGWYNDYNLIPFFVDGTFRNFQMRRDQPDKRIRSYYKSVGRLPFNFDILKIVDKIIISEGPTDCLKLNQEGIASVSSNSGATGWQNDWFKYFIRMKEIYVVFDNDSAGKKGAVKVAQNLGVYRTRIFTFDGFDDKYDCVNFFQDGGTKDQFLDLVKDKAKYTFEV